MQSLEDWRRHFHVFRVTLGAYLTWHFVHLLPWSAELFLPNGVLESPALNRTYGLFPNVINRFGDSTLAIHAFILLLTMASLLLTFGRLATISSLLLWYGWTCLFNSNNLIMNPSLPYIGWLLLATAYISARPLRAHRELQQAATFLLAIGYGISGWAKLISPSWQNGTAIRYVLENPLARDYFFRDWLAALPNAAIHTLSWMTVAIELLYLPLTWSARTRPWVWLAMVGLHLGILFAIGFADLTAGMLIIHLFVFDPKWLYSFRFDRSLHTEQH